MLGRIRGVQLRSGSVSDKDGNKKLVIDSIDKVRNWIDFMISANSSRVKPIQPQTLGVPYFLVSKFSPMT